MRTVISLYILPKCGNKLYLIFLYTKYIRECFGEGPVLQRAEMTRVRSSPTKLTAQRYDSTI